jgi:hypothetical protein
LRRLETIEVCHILLNDPQFISMLLLIDRDLAEQRRSRGCPCGGVLHRADYPRKPRGCPPEARADCNSRFSFCCNQCRKRVTVESVRFMGRRVYLSLAVVLLSGRRARPTAAHVQVAEALAVPVRTVARWRHWWAQVFPATSLWQAYCARFMPPVEAADLPCALIARFTGTAVESMRRLLACLCPLSVPQ